jgi:hypothetical protein
MLQHFTFLRIFDNMMSLVSIENIATQGSHGVEDEEGRLKSPLETFMASHVLDDDWCLVPGECHWPPKLPTHQTLACGGWAKRQNVGSSV